MYYLNQQTMHHQQPRIMTVIGVGELSLEPDIVEIQFEVISENEQLSLAQRENNEIMNEVLNALGQLGIDRADIKTISYRIFPQYDYIDGKQIFKDYKVTNTISVKIKDIANAGNVIDVAVENGVTDVSNIHFKIENERKFYLEALSLSLKNSLVKAQTLAKTMGISIDIHPIKIIEEFTGTGPVAMAKLSSNYTSTPIEQGQFIIRANVEVQYRY